MQNDPKKVLNPENAHKQFMCCKMLKWIRKTMKFDPRDMRDELGGMNRRTYEDYEAGKRNIPSKVANAVRESLERDRAFYAGMDARIDKKLKGKKIQSIKEK